MSSNQWETQPEMRRDQSAMPSPPAIHAEKTLVFRRSDWRQGPWGVTRVRYGVTKVRFKGKGTVKAGFLPQVIAGVEFSSVGSGFLAADRVTLKMQERPAAGTWEAS